MSFVVRLAGLAAAAGFAAAQSKVTAPTSLTSSDAGSFGFYGIAATANSLFVASGVATTRVAVGDKGVVTQPTAPLTGPAACNSTNSTRLRALQEVGASNNSSNCTGAAPIGFAVAASDNGRIVIAGGAGMPGDSGSYISRDSGNTWAAFTSQDAYIALSGDGSIAVVADSNYATSVFNAATGDKISDLAAPANWALWPASMTVSGNGGFIAIAGRRSTNTRRLGVTQLNDAGVSAGTATRPSAVFVFVRTPSGSYMLFQTLRPPSKSNETQSMYGFAVALSDDGFALAVSEPLAATNAAGTSMTGAVYVLFLNSTGYAPSTITNGVSLGPFTITQSYKSQVLFGNSLSWGGANASAMGSFLAVGAVDFAGGALGGVALYSPAVSLNADQVPSVSFRRVTDFINPSGATLCGMQVAVGDDYYAFTCGSAQQGGSGSPPTVYVGSLPLPPEVTMFSSKAAPTPSAAPGTNVVRAALTFGGVTATAFKNPQTVLDLQDGILASYRSSLSASDAASVSIAVSRISNADTGDVIWTSTGARRLQAISVKVDYTVIVAAGASANALSSVTTLTSSSSLAATVATNVAAAAASSGNTALAATMATATVAVATPTSTTTTSAASSPSIVGPVVGGVIGGLAAIIIAVFAFRTLSAKKGDPSQFQGENPMPKRSQVVPA